MIESNNKYIVEVQSCIVCARLFKILSIFDLKDKFLNCTVLKARGHRVPDQNRPLVACDTHITGEIDAAYTRCHSI
jgi:hypothetical protein